MPGAKESFGLIAGATILGAVVFWRLLPEANKNGVKNSLRRMVQRCPWAAYSLRMYLDADRDGAVDINPVNYGVWQAGALGPGAVIMVNTRQYANGLDVPARMEVRFRWDANGTDPVGWQATLTIDHPGRVVIYPTPVQGAVPIIPGPGGVISLHNGPFQATVAAGTLSVWIEAANFPNGPTPAELVMLTFQSIASDGAINDQQAQLRIAPWIMASDLDPNSAVWYVENAVPTLMQQAIANFLPPVAGMTRTPPNIQGAGYKPFMRDVMRCGWVVAPHHRDIAIMERLDEASVFNGLATLNAGVGVVSNARAGVPINKDNGQTSQDNGGNMLVSPPTVNYPLGRIIYGAGAVADPDTDCHAANFFNHQALQAPLQVNSAWLSVGHADEFISFVPHPADPRWKYKILLASPRLGYILAHAASANPDAGNVAALVTAADLTNTAARAAEAAAGADWAVLQGDLPATQLAAAPHPAAPGVYLADPAPPAHQNGKHVTWAAGNAYRAESIDTYLTDVNNYHPDLYNLAQGPIDAARLLLLAGLGDGAALTDDYIIEIPVLLEASGGKCVTGTADSVNLLLLGNRCLVPKPFGPVCGGVYLFEYYIRTRLEALGMNVTFLNDWDTFHRKEGEIHCGTNQIPLPLAADRDWWL